VFASAGLSRSDSLQSASAASSALLATARVRQPEVRPRATFLSDYDLLLTEHLVQGVDVWVNTPRRPWEASGTSGMKVLVNGGINLALPQYLGPPAD
jgi:glucan phosphorylase